MLPLLLHSCSRHLGFLSFQRDEETCPTLAPACSCTSGHPGLPGPPGPPVSSPFHMFLQSSIYCILVSCCSGTPGLRIILLGLHETLCSISCPHPRLKQRAALCCPAQTPELCFSVHVAVFWECNSCTGSTLSISPCHVNPLRRGEQATLGVCACRDFVDHQL